MSTVLITGGTGMIGQALTKSLLKKGYEVIVLTRNKERQKPAGNIIYANWNIENGIIEKAAIEKADYIVHLAGASVAGKRWTDKRKKEILESRTKSGELIVKALQEIPNNVKTIISASAIGWYGADPQIPNPNPFIEQDSADNSFLGNTARQWEAAIQPVRELGKRLVIYRTGIVLSNEGGAYAEFKKPMKLGVASILGNGKQILSWIHIDDLVQLYIYAIENEKLNDVYNAAAPNPVSNKELIKSMAKAKGGFHITAYVPEFVLKIMLGEMSIEILKSATVSNKKIEAAGYQFIFPTIEKALVNLNKKAS
ncbi:MAG TPA: TIGR01777 family oxidoreductase [Chitinophagaceae bacterium]|nr:TIGR01777 family oxidoreductase [Chitinophagaceae bacterium]